MTGSGRVRRPDRLVVVAGTGTDVGKTWVSARLIELWRASGRRVMARKIAQSFDPSQPPTDSQVLSAASGEDPNTVCSPEYSFETPMAPPMAADALGRPVPELADLLGALSWPDDQPVETGGRLSPVIGLVETAGGLCSPQAGDGDALDVIAALLPDTVILVGEAGLGTINSVRLSLRALEPLATAGEGRCAVAVVLNRFDQRNALHRRNFAWLHQCCGLEMTTIVLPTLSGLARRIEDGAIGSSLAVSPMQAH